MREREREEKEKRDNKGSEKKERIGTHEGTFVAEGVPARQKSARIGHRAQTFFTGKLILRREKGTLFRVTFLQESSHSNNGTTARAATTTHCPSLAETLTRIIFTKSSMRCVVLSNEEASVFRTFRNW